MVANMSISIVCRTGDNGIIVLSDWRSQVQHDHQLYLPQSQVISAISVDHILQVVWGMEKLAVLPLTASFLHLIVAGHHSIADRTRRYSKKH